MGPFFYSPHHWTTPGNSLIGGILHRTVSSVRCARQGEGCLPSSRCSDRSPRNKTTPPLEQEGTKQEARGPSHPTPYCPVPPSAGHDSPGVQGAALLLSKPWPGRGRGSLSPTLSESASRMSDQTCAVAVAPLDTLPCGHDRAFSLCNRQASKMDRHTQRTSWH